MQVDKGTLNNKSKQIYKKIVSERFFFKLTGISQFWKKIFIDN